MRFWRDIETELGSATKEAQEDFMDSLSTPHAFDVLRTALDYLHACRTEDRMKLTDDRIEKTDPGMKLAIERLKNCGQTAFKAKYEG